MPTGRDENSEQLSHDNTIREAVRRRYAAAGAHFAAGRNEEARAVEAPCSNTPACSTAGPAGDDVFGADLYGLYDSATVDGVPHAAVAASLGCGVPTAVAELHPGDTVVDLGSGAGADVLISARRVAPGGRAIGVDMTTEMLELARRNATEAGVTNVEFLDGYLEDLPLPDASVDVVISNCVINLTADKRIVLREAARVLRPGGRFAVTDVVADPDIDDATRAGMEQWTGCIAGALTEAEYRAGLIAAGLREIEIVETHRVHRHAASVIIRASKPAQ